ncbi:MAG: GxxExxY protein [Gammaproteobacteria bacterium]|nr:GxxExxY protein [Gammaproteobacteria bacterium]
MQGTLSQRVIRCAFDVSNTLGAGFLEKVYENALCIEFENNGLKFQAQKPITVNYKGFQVGEYIADIIVEDKLLLELKAIESLGRSHDAQVMNYLKATNLSVGLLLNFGRPKLDIRRIVWQHNDTNKI